MRPPLKLAVSVPARLRALREEWERVDPPRRPVVFINPRSGDGKAVRAALADRARERGVEPVVLGPEDDLATLVAIAVGEGADALGMAGGDGSLATVAAAAAERDLPFICLPAGTRNHFALDLGIARHDLIGALDAFTEALERRIDMAEVNGRPFLNNVSLGVYGDAVQRSAYRDAKLRTMLDTLHEVLSSTAPTPELLVTDERPSAHLAAGRARVQQRVRLDQPQARGFAATARHRPTGHHRAGSAWRRAPAVFAWSAPSLEIAGTAAVPAGLDGEAVTLLPPLHFTSRPAALRVRISRHHPGASPSALLSLP